MTTSLHIPTAPAGGWLVLIGGGEFSFGDTEEVDRFLLSRLPAENRTVAFLPTASGSPEYGHHFGEYLRKLDVSVSVATIPIYRGRDVRRPKNLMAIRNAGLVYLGGGVTNNLIETIAGSPVEEVLREVHADGGTIAAIGAAAACFGTTVRDMRRVPALMPALGWIENAIVEPLFDAANDRMIRALMATPSVDIGYGIPAGTALAIAPDRQGEIAGDGKIAVLRRPSAGE